MSFVDLFNQTPAEEGNTYKTLPEGNYNAILSESKMDLSSAPIKVTLIFSIVDNEEFANQKLFKNFRGEGSSFGWLKHDMKIMGIELPTAISSDDELSDLLQSKQGEKFAVFVKPKEYNGNTYNNMFINGPAIDAGIDKNDSIPM